MQKRLLAIVFLIPVLGACTPISPNTPSATPSVSVEPSFVTPTPSVAPSQCHARVISVGFTLPDPICTPGAVNPNVTQENISVTICKSGWSSSIRPPTSYTTPLKIKEMVLYGYMDSLSAHELDHLIPLSIGGAPKDQLNLWPEPTPAPNPKDSVESALYRAVCNNKVTLQSAQQAIASDWTTARAKLGV